MTLLSVCCGWPPLGETDLCSAPGCGEHNGFVIECPECEGSRYRPYTRAEYTLLKDHPKCRMCNGEGVIDYEPDRIMANGSGSVGALDNTNAGDRAVRPLAAGVVARSLAYAEEVDGLANALVKMGIADTKEHALTALRRQLR